MFQSNKMCRNCFHFYSENFFFHFFIFIAFCIHWINRTNLIIYHAIKWQCSFDHHHYYSLFVIPMDSFHFIVSFVNYQLYSIFFSSLLLPYVAIIFFFCIEMRFLFSGFRIQFSFIHFLCIVFILLLHNFFILLPFFQMLTACFIFIYCLDSFIIL